MTDTQQKYGRRARRTATAITTFAALTAVGVTAACGPGSSTANRQANSTPTIAPISMTITPAAGTANLPISTEVGVAVKSGKVTDVSLTKAGSAEKIAGAMRDDGTSWIPAAPLGFSSNYNVAVTGRGADGRTVTQKTSFSTMAKPGNEADTGLYLTDGETVGVAMPVVIEFDPPVPDAARAAVQKRLFVTTNPAQPGVWQWASGKQVWYRAPNYWQPGTTISVRAALAGQPLGEGRYGSQDWTATAKVGNKVFLDVDNATKQMKAYVNDQLVRTMPVSLGKPSTPSSSGYMVLMSHLQSTIFDTTAEGPGGYRVSVNWAMRLTWGGEFIHAAPWSVGDQGVRNVSHGCLNMSDENSHWLYDSAHVGDPIRVRGTEVALTNGNGWTAWNVPWSEYIKGSALPVPAALAKQTTTPESVSAIAPPAPAPTQSSTPPAKTPAAATPAVASTP
jgi:lipoprotein-anchoring transpeptidase ErfK/SrfK